MNQTPNSIEWILIELACSALNAIHVPLDPRLPKEQSSNIVGAIEPCLAITESENKSDSGNTHPTCLTTERIRAVVDSSIHPETDLVVEKQDRFSPTDTANILYTSGTTRSPKGVMLSHKNLVSNAFAKLDAMPQFLTDHRLNLLPFSHAYAKTCELATWLISGSSLELVSSDNLLATFSISKPTLFNGVPVVYQRIYKEWMQRGGGSDSLLQLLGRRIRQLASGGAPIRDDLRNAFEQAGLPIYQGYGLTEAGPVVCSNRSGAVAGPLDRNLQGVGPPVLGVELRIDLQRKLWVRGAGVMSAYWKDPLGTRERIVEGWLDTGDVACIDESGNVKILGRCDDTLVLDNGYKIDPLAVEQSICEMEGIADCALIPTTPSAYDLLILYDATIENPPKLEWENKIKELIAQQLVQLPRRIVFTRLPWTEQNGLRNFKGGKNRAKIRLWYEQILSQL